MTTATKIVKVKEFITDNKLMDEKDTRAIEVVARQLTANPIFAMMLFNPSEFAIIICGMRNCYYDGLQDGLL